VNPNNQARPWLRRNGYEDIADMIDRIIAENRALGKKTRRNWWDVLAGSRKGAAYTVNGRSFPVLATLRSRKGYPPVKHAIKRRKEHETPTPIQVTPRWHPEMRTVIPQ